MRRILSRLLLTLLSAVAGDAAEEIKPTATRDMGDRGGLFFGARPDPQRTCHYFIAAEAESWDYAPTGRDEVCGLPLPAPVVAAPRNDKLRYVQYTDATFGTRVFQNPALGLLGPVLRGVVGDWIAVTFLNRTSQPLSMHPHGVRYDKDSEGAHYRPGPGLGSAVGPGATFTYVWQLDANAGPLPGEPSSKAWLYHSHVQGDEEANLGLIGFIIVTDPARARPDGTPADVDREFGALFMIFDESGVEDEAQEAAEYADLPPASRPRTRTWTEIQQLLEQGERHAINGRSFGHLPGLEANEGDRVRWYLFGLGDERDFHTAHWHGQRVVAEGRRTDVVELLPASMKVADLVADNPGTWLFHCHVAEHMRNGMFARFVVHPRAAVGADRSPAAAFLGLPATAQSLRFTRAEATLAPGSAEITLVGEATVFEAFSVFNQPIQLQLGQRTATFRPASDGTAAASGATLQIVNAGPLGVIYGGVLRFEVRLGGADWRREIDALGAAAATTTLTVPLTLRLGQARHQGQAAIALARQGGARAAN